MLFNNENKKNQLVEHWMKYFFPNYFITYIYIVWNGNCCKIIYRFSFSYCVRVYTYKYKYSNLLHIWMYIKIALQCPANSLYYNLEKSVYLYWIVIGGQCKLLLDVQNPWYSCYFKLEILNKPLWYISIIMIYVHTKLL